jgi:hypothetical protein
MNMAAIIPALACINIVLVLVLMTNKDSHRRGEDEPVVDFIALVLILTALEAVVYAVAYFFISA